MPSAGSAQQRLGAGPVQLEPLGGQQVVGDGLGEQGVAELVAVARPRARARGARRRRAARCRSVAASTPATRSSRACGTRRPMTAATRTTAWAVVVEPVDPGEQQPGEVGRGRRRRGPRRRRRAPRRRRRCPRRARATSSTTSSSRSAPARRTMRRRSASGSGPELDAGEARQARPQREGESKRVTAVDVVAAVGGEERDAVGAAAGEQQGQQLAGRLVGPVDVLDDDEQRPAAAEVGEGAVHGLDEVGAHGVAAGTRRDPRARGAPARGGRRRARRRGSRSRASRAANISTKGR